MIGVERETLHQHLPKKHLLSTVAIISKSRSLASSFSNKEHAHELIPSKTEARTKLVQPYSMQRAAKNSYE
jgi:hypothetical protein